MVSRECYDEFGDHEICSGEAGCFSENVSRLEIKRCFEGAQRTNESGRLRP